MKRYLIGLFLAISSYLAYAQTTSERLGNAAAMYFGSAVFLKVVSESSCQLALTTPSTDYDLTRVRSNISQRLSRYLEKAEYQQLSGVLYDAEQSIRNDFTPSLRAATPSQCHQFATALSEKFFKHKSAWLALTR